MMMMMMGVQKCDGGPICYKICFRRQALLLSFLFQFPLFTTESEKERKGLLWVYYGLLRIKNFRKNHKILVRMWGHKFVEAFLAEQPDHF